MRAAMLLFAFATLCFTVGYLATAFFLLREVLGTPLLHMLFQPRPSRSDYVLRKAYVLPPADLPAVAHINPRVIRLYEALKVNAYGVILAAMLTVIAAAVEALA
jgi:hypothetical protein